MNTTTLNMTTLDGGVIIKRGEGGGATINNQDKVVDITENGTTEVVADGGFTGLGKVTINTEVSGGGDAPSGDWRYFDRTIKTPTNEVGAMIGLFTLFKQEQGGQKGIMPVSYMAILDNQFYTNASALAIDLNMPFVMQGVPFTTVGEFINAQMQSIENMANGWNWTEITEEQFYNLD